MDNVCYAMKRGGVDIILSECPDITEPREFFQWLEYPSALELEKALRGNFTIAGWVALKEVECNGHGPFVLLTRQENFAFIRQTPLTMVSSMEEALRVAYEQCGTQNPKVTVMPQGANTLPILRKKASNPSPPRGA